MHTYKLYILTYADGEKYVGPWEEGIYMYKYICIYTCIYINICIYVCINIHK
jgi:hypothetical protein